MYIYMYVYMYMYMYVYVCICMYMYMYSTCIEVTLLLAYMNKVEPSIMDTIGTSKLLLMEVSFVDGHLT